MKRLAIIILAAIIGLCAGSLYGKRIKNITTRTLR